MIFLIGSAFPAVMLRFHTRVSGAATHPVWSTIVQSRKAIVCFIARVPSNPAPLRFRQLPACEPLVLLTAWFASQFFWIASVIVDNTRVVLVARRGIRKGGDLTLVT